MAGEKGEPGERGPQGPAGVGLDQLVLPTGSALVGYKHPAASTVARTVATKLSESLSFKDFGAKGDGVTDDRVAMQLAIDTVSAAGGGTLRLPVGTYMLTLTPAADGGVIGLLLRDNVTIVGESMFKSAIKMKDAMTGPGTYLRLISSYGMVSNVVLHNFTIDGNRSGQGLWARQGNGGNLVFHGRSVVIDGVRSIEAQGQGIQVRGSREQPCTRVVIQNCIAEGMSGSTMNVDGTVALEYNGNGIGIQVSQCEDLKIIDNTITGCKDNGIDTYNENVDYTTTPPTVYSPTGGIALIQGNTVTNSRCGIFPETTARMIVTGNYISGMVEAGVAINRINSAPEMMTVSNNTIEYTLTGIRMTGNATSARITDNFIGFITGGNGAGIYLENASYTLVQNNVFKIAYAQVPLVAFTGPQGVFCHVTNNMHWGKPDPGYLTYSAATSMFGTVIEDWRGVSALDTSTIGEGRFYRVAGKVDNLATNSLTAGTAGFNGAAPRGKGALPADGSDLATTQALANAVKALLISYGLAS